MYHYIRDSAGRELKALLSDKKNDFSFIKSKLPKKKLDKMCSTMTVF